MHIGLNMSTHAKAYNVYFSHSGVGLCEFLLLLEFE